MKNLIYTLAAGMLLFSCEKSEPVPEMENGLSSARYTKKMTMEGFHENESVDIGVIPIDRELYEYSVKATGEPVKEVEESFAGYAKEYGEEYPEAMQLTFLFNAENAIIFRPPPIPCSCNPVLIPDDYEGSVKLDNILFKVFAFDPSRIAVYLTNEKGEVLYAPAEKTEGKLNSNSFLKLRQVRKISGEEFFITVITNYLSGDKIVKKVLTYSFSEKML